jgi:outer membrane protein assembly factor BamB
LCTISVTCYTINGEKLWKFKDESVLMTPLGVAVDNNSNIYVTSGNYKKVIVLSPDGEQWSNFIHPTCDWLITMIEVY